MPKVIGPLFSLDAQGNLAHTLNFCTRKDVNLVRQMTFAYPTVTDKLQGIQNFMRRTVWTWQHLTENIIDDWDTWASNYMKQGSGFNAFTSYYMTGLIDGIIPDLFPPT